MAIPLAILHAYQGPEFLEYCVSERGYLPATRDRASCATCVLGELCQAGFEEQVRRVRAGENPSLTDVEEFKDTDVDPESVLQGLLPEQVEFIRNKIGAHLETEQ